MNTRHIGKTLAMLIASGLAAQVSTAQTAPSTDPAVQLQKIDVVAAPIASLPSVDRYSGSTTSVGEDQLRDLNALDFASALRRTPGVTISRFNQVGSFGGAEGGAIFLRGLGSSRPGGEIKMMVDGVPKLNGVFNHPLLDLMSIDTASRIDVSTRATPTSVGNAFATVNVITPRVLKEGQLARSDISGGSFGTYAEHLAYGAKEGAFDTYFSQSYRHSDGQRPDSDGSLENYFLRLGWTLNPEWDLSYEINHTHNLATDPGSNIPLSGPASTKGETYETADWLHIAVLTHTSSHFSGSLRAYLNDGEGNWIRRQYSRNADSLNDWRLYGVRWKETMQLWDGGEVIVGADLDFERGSTTTVPLAPASASSYKSPTLRILSPYAGISHSFSLSEGMKLTPSAGLRYYSHSDLGSKSTPQAGLILADGATQYHLSYGRAVNYPGVEVLAFSNLLIPALGQSWRTLKPEEVDQFEVGVHHAFSKDSSVSLTAFSNQARNRYVIAFPPPPPPRYTNLESYRTQGLELTGESRLSESLALFGSVAIMSSSPGDVPYAPRGTYTSGLNWRFAKDWMLSVDGNYLTSMHVASQARTAGAVNTLEIGAHFLLNARLSRRFLMGKHSVEFYASGENLTDRAFAYTPGYPIPGINGMLGVSCKW